MMVKELIKILKTLDKNAIIDMASDEEGNSFGDISDSLAEGTIGGIKCYTLYPENNIDSSERYDI